MTSAAVDEFVATIGFEETVTARRRLEGLCPNEATRRALTPSLPALLHALLESADPDVSLLNFERYAQTVPDRESLFTFLGEHPRAVEILLRLFVGSQFLTEILLRQPESLEQLTQYGRLAEFKHREALIDAAHELARVQGTYEDKLDAVRRFQKRELLRLGACDTFGLMDLKTVTLQLSLLADSVTQVCLDLAAADLNIDATAFAIIAFGKLGGEELNYSSDVDLVFIADSNAERYWPLAQRLVRALNDSTREGFLYRVDLRLRPWGKSGPLVCTTDAYVDYLRTEGRLWEKQALLKARGIAGNHRLSDALLDRLQPIVFAVAATAVRENVREMKQEIERKVTGVDGPQGDVKSGPGGIRDVEFTVQALQLIHGREQESVRSRNTLDGIVRLADVGYLQAEEYRSLYCGYLFLRTIEHALQLLHNMPTHRLPTRPRELAYLACRLDYPNSEEFVRHYDRHRDEVRCVFERQIVQAGEQSIPAGVETQADTESVSSLSPARLGTHFGSAIAEYRELFDDEQTRRQLALLEKVDNQTIVQMATRALGNSQMELTVAGFDQLGGLSILCGLLFVFGYDIESGQVFTGDDLPLLANLDNDRITSDEVPPSAKSRRRKFVNVFTVRGASHVVTPALWTRYEADLRELLLLVQVGKLTEAQGRLATRVAAVVQASSDRSSSSQTSSSPMSSDQNPARQNAPTAPPRLLPVEIDIDIESSPTETILEIRTLDTVGFLYELTNALNQSGVSINRMQVRVVGEQVFDTFHVTDQRGLKITDDRRLLELRAAIVLIQQFTHLLPFSPNPRRAQIHFREFLEGLFSRGDWIDELADLQDSAVLATLAKLLGVSDFLWEDFLKLQHANLFPVLTDLEALQHAKPPESLGDELTALLGDCSSLDEQRVALNAFKDREMLRVDMRHILKLQGAFGMFSRELTDIAECVVKQAVNICRTPLVKEHGVPRLRDGDESRLTVCALGKCGGRELGFASDIELMFVYDRDGQTDGSSSIPNVEFYQSLIDSFRKTIQARRQGIFEIDLRMRPYGRAGSLAVSRDSFHKYYGPDGPAWPYERQALVKLRPIAGDEEMGDEIVSLRNRLLYTGQPFDVGSMRAMRERQLRQLVEAGTFNAKLSFGGLVDVEYIVQGLLITHGHSNSTLRNPNTREALKALAAAGIVSEQDRLLLRDAYRFLRRLIDALRMVRGNAHDLTVPATGTEEFEFLARRLGGELRVTKLADDIDRHTANVRDLTRLLDH